MNNSNGNEQRVIMGQSVKLSYKDYKVAQALIICTYSDLEEIKEIPERSVDSIKKGNNDIVTLEQKRIELVNTVKQIDSNLNIIRNKMHGMAEVVIDLIDSDKFEGIYKKAELAGINDIEKAQKKYEEQVAQQIDQKNNGPEKEKVLGQNLNNAEEFADKSNVVDGNFDTKGPVNNTPNDIEEESDISIAGAAGKSGVADVIENIEELNRKSAISKDIESEKE